MEIDLKTADEGAAAAVNDFFPDTPDTPETPPAAPPRAVEAPPVVETPPVPPAENKVNEAEVVTEPKAKPVVSDEELEAKLESVKAKNSNQEKGFTVLKGLVKDERAGRLDAEKKAKEFEDKLKELEGKEQLTPEIKQQLEELQQYRKAEDPSKDPEIQQKYVSQLEARNNQALNILKSHDMKDSILEMIKEAGGISVISNSSQPVPPSLGKQTWSDWLADVILPRLPLADQKRMERLIADTADISDKMNEEVEHAKTNVKEYSEAKAKKMEALYAEGAQETIKNLGPLAQKWEYPKDATDVDKARVDKHNARFEKVAGLYQHLEAGIKDPKTLGIMIVTAAQSIYLAEANKDLFTQNEELNKKYQELETRYNKLKGSSAATRQTNAPIAGSEPVKPNLNIDSKQAVNEFFK